MSAKTKIVVLHRKEIIRGGIYVILGLLFLFLLSNLFSSPSTKDSTKNRKSKTENQLTAQSNSPYIPGVYTTELMLNDQAILIEVTIEASGITSIEMGELEDSILTMYPLLETTFKDLANQICEKQSVENITYKQESKYTSLVLLEAIKKALEKAQP